MFTGVVALVLDKKSPTEVGFSNVPRPTQIGRVLLGDFRCFYACSEILWDEFVRWELSKIDRYCCWLMGVPFMLCFQRLAAEACYDHLMVYIIKPSLQLEDMNINSSRFQLTPNMCIILYHNQVILSHCSHCV